MAEKRECEGCGKSYSRSGYYKHRKTCDAYASLGAEEMRFEAIPEPSGTPTPPEPSEAPESEGMDNSGDIPNEPETPDWFDFGFDDEDDTATEHFPTALKMVAGRGPPVQPGRKMSAKEIEAFHDTNINLLIMGLGGADFLMQSYGRAVCMDPNLTIKHSDGDKEMTARAQYAWMLEHGINPSAYMGTGTVAAALTGYYIIPPMLKIRKRKKVALFTGMAVGKVGGILSKIPLVGRFFKRRSGTVVTYDTPVKGASQ